MNEPPLAIQLPAEDDHPQTGPLGITEERLNTIGEEICTRLQECRNEMGLDYASGDGYRISARGRPNSWAWKRQCYRLEYMGNFTHRRAMGGVFLENGAVGGWSLQVPQRFVRLMASKISGNIVGTDPFCAFMPEKIDDKEEADMAKQVEKKIQRELSRSNMQEVLSESIRVALTENERAIKLTWNVEATQFAGPARVMIGEDGQPFRTPNGDYVFPKDDTLDVVVDQQGAFVRAVLSEDIDPATGAPVLQPGEFMLTRLRKEPGVVLPQDPQFTDFPNLLQKIEHANQLQADGLFTEDFIYPITVPRLGLADIMAHVYDAPLADLNARYPNSGYNARLLSATGARSRAGQPIYEAGEQMRETKTRELFCIHETYYRCRVNPEDEHESWLFVVIDFTNRVPIYAEYLGNMKMKRPPFVLLRGLESEPCRAYGVGIWQKFWDKNIAIDCWFNRLALKSSKEGSVTCVHRDGFEETADGHDLIIGGKEHYHIPANANGEGYNKNNPPVFRINLNEIDDFAWEIIEKLIQGGVLDFGMTSMGELPSGEAGIGKGATATATRNIERTGNTLQDSTEDLMGCDVTELLKMACDIILENADADELQWIAGENRLASLNRDEIRNLPRDVRLLLTKARSAESIETNTQVKATILEYYGLPKVRQRDVRFAYINILRSYDVPDADTILREPTDEEIAAEAQAQQMAGVPETERMTLNLKDLIGSEREQGLAKFGITAASPEEIAQAEAAEQAAKEPANLSQMPRKAA